MFHFYFHFYYFHSISFHIDVREIYELHCILSYGVSFTIHCVVYDTLRRLRYTASFTIHCVVYDTPRHYASIRRPSPATIPGVHPGVHPTFIRHPIRSTSSVLSYLRYNLTADSRTSLVPAIFHFYFHFYYFHSISFHIDVREIYEVQCVLYDTLRPTPNLSNIHIIFYIFHHFLTILHSSVIHPVYFFCVFLLCISSVYPGVYPDVHSGTHSVLHLRSNFTFGTILPRILEQVLCPRYSTFILFFITFHFIPYYVVREIYALHCILSYGVSFTIHYIRRASRRASRHIFGQILPSVQSYRGF